MKIGTDEVRKIARLAEMAVDDAELPRLVSQLVGIVAYVAQLEAAPVEGDVEPFVPGPQAVAWRTDVVAPQPLALPPASLAPEFREGFFVVPRLAGMEEA